MNARALLAVLFLSRIAAGPAEASIFSFECPDDRFVSQASGQSHRFEAPIRGLLSGGHAVQVTFRPRLPETWFAQWGQQSNGGWHYEDQQIVLQGGLQDRLRIEIYPDPGTVGHGWVDLTIRAVEDPFEVARCTFTLFSGVPVPPVDFSIDCRDNTRWLDESQYFEFHSPLANERPETDTLMVSLFTQLVEGWDMHFCHGGICQLSYGEFPIYPGAPDSIVMMCYAGEIPGASAADMVLQSKSNPSLAQYCGYRIYLQQPQGVETPSGPPATARISISPNPGAGAMTFRMPAGSAENGAIEIFGADGRVVRELALDRATTGFVRATWDGRDAAGREAPPGVYFYRWRGGGSDLRGTLVRVR